MKILSSIEGPYIGPYVYFIISSQHIYIGETQKHPVIRWGAHLNQNGSFYSKLSEDFNISRENLIFISINCTPYISKISDNAKTTTQALEHSLHCCVSSNPSYFGWEKKLISSTEKTAPRKFKYWNEVNKISNEIVSKAKLLIIENPSE